MLRIVQQVGKLHRFAERYELSIVVIGCSLGIALRCWVATFPHSGEDDPPMYGDFEAQRHWMEITTNLPVSQWYEETKDNDLQYWGLDYPPLTAFHMYLTGLSGIQIVPKCFELFWSRGYESPLCRLFIRATVVFADEFTYIPAACFASQSLTCPSEHSVARLMGTMGLWFLLPQVLIDHGHFQYNGVCFALVLAAVGCVVNRRKLAASFFFTSAFLYKQIALYYAPAFFFGILSLCIQEGKTKSGIVWQVFVTGSVVIATIVLLFLPWLLGPTPLASVLQIIHRMFPFARGLYEDKVANVWCSISVVFKLQRFVPAEVVPKVCALVTLQALLPTCLTCLRRSMLTWSSDDFGRTLAFVVSLYASSMSFFLFGFQVHEKAILFPCLAACLIPISLGPFRRPDGAFPMLMHFLLVSTYSMYPLVVKDKLFVPYSVFCIVLLLAAELPSAPAGVRAVHRLCNLVGFLLHGVHAYVPPPPRYPDLWTLLITSSSCAYFLASLVLITWMQVSGRLGTLPDSLAKDFAKAASSVAMMEISNLQREAKAAAEESESDEAASRGALTKPQQRRKPQDSPAAPRQSSSSSSSAPPPGRGKLHLKKTR